MSDTPNLDALRRHPKHLSARFKLALSRLLLDEIGHQNITIYELAKRAGLRQQLVRDYCAALTEPAASKLYLLDEGLGKPRGWIAAKLART